VASVPFDTSSDGHVLQTQLYQRLGGRARIQIMFGLTGAVRRMAIAGIRARHPHYSDDEVHRAYGRLVLGDEAARSVWPDRELVNP
jgi:hypothetical protein